MSQQALQSFRETVSSNAQLEPAVRACLTGSGGALDLDALAALGKHHGFDFSAEDVRTVMASNR